MFTQQEAEIFVKNLFENIFSTGDDELLRPYYTQDFVGHYLDDVFYFEDLKKRIRTIKSDGMKTSFKVAAVIVSGDFINSFCDLTVKKSSTDEVFNSKQILVWKMQGKQIKESWIVMEHDTEYYQRIHPDLGFYTRLTKLFTQKEAEDFVKKVFETIIIRNNVDQLDEFFAPDFVGYNLENTYNFSELKKIINQLLSENLKFNIKLHSVESFGDFINVGVNVVWEANDSQESVSSEHTIVWFMENRRIKVSWVMQDKIAARNELKSPDIDKKQLSISTEVEIRQFFERLNQDVILDCRTDLILNYYTPDFVGHLNNITFDLEDIKVRSQAIKNETKNFSYTLEKIMTNGNFVTASTNFSYLSKKSNTLHDGRQYNVYLMQDGRVKESWVMMDRDTESYQKLNEYIVNEGSQFEIKTKTRDEFLKLLEKVFNQKRFHAFRYTPVMRECIYYYLNGYSSKEIAQEMNLTYRTVEAYLAQIRDQLGCSNRQELRKLLFP